jgi:GNAT superfamily N-acetyltransferase
LSALAEAPYAFGTKLAEWQGAGDTEARWRARLSTVPFNVVAFAGGEPAGIASGTAPTESRTVELISMWVAPFARGRGTGDALVAAVIAWARLQNARRVTADVVAGNAHACALYERHGFVAQCHLDAAQTGDPPQRRLVLVLET